MLTVTTAATKFDLITLASMRTALELVERGDDPFLKAAITHASDVLARRCKRVFAQETVAETFRLAASQDDLILARYPVSAIVSIVENGTTLVATDYELNGDTGILSRLSADSFRCWSPVKIVVTYTTGFVLPTDCPPALARACTRLVQQYYSSADRDPMVRSDSADQVDSASYFDGRAGAEHLSPEVIGLIRPFINVRAR